MDHLQRIGQIRMKKRLTIRARALFAMLTAMARDTEFFREQPSADQYTFFDLAKLLGFELITFTDGDKFAHQIVLE